MVAFAAALAPDARAAEAKNVIIFISDGGGFNAYWSASYYQHGRLGGQPYDSEAWSKYASLTASLNTMKKDASEDDDEPSYDPSKAWSMEGVYAMALAGGTSFKGYTELKNSPTDSAASGTAMALGEKAYNGAVNYVPDYSQRIRAARGRTISELAKAKGKSTGVVTSVYWSDATPSTFGGAHSSGRGKKTDIANQMLNSGTLDLIMGGGHPEYDRNGAPVEPTKESDYEMIGGSFTWNMLTSGRHAQGWKLVQSKPEFEALMSGPTPARVLGIPRVHQTLQQQRQTRDWNRDGRVDDTDVRAAAAFTDPFIATVPTLATMTRGALNVLGKNPKGFYVMIEGGAVDWAGHANQPGRIIEEMIGFNAAVQAAQDWVNHNSSWDETLIIITSDHETGLLLGLNSDRMVFDPVINRGAGRMPGMYFNSGGHSNLLVPIRARGPGAELFEKYVKGHDPVHGRYVDNTTIFEVAKTAMGATPPSSYGDNYGNGGYGGSSPYGGGSYSPGGELLYDSEPAGPRNYGSYGNNGGSYGSPTPSTRPSTTYND